MEKSFECDDAISREDRLLDLANAIEIDDSGYWTNKRISSALRNISSVTQNSGKWLITSISHIAYCSKCDYLFKDIPTSIVKHFKYCPNCGSYNGGDKNGNE